MLLKRGQNLFIQSTTNDELEKSFAEDMKHIVKRVGSTPISLRYKPCPVLPTKRR